MKLVYFSAGLSGLLVRECLFCLFVWMLSVGFRDGIVSASGWHCSEGIR